MSGVLVVIQVSCTFNNDRHLTYTCTYSPSLIGRYKLSIFFAGREIPKSPYVVDIYADPSKVSVNGPGVDCTGLLQLNQMTSFHVDTSSETHSSLSVCLSVQSFSTLFFCGSRYFNTTFSYVHCLNVQC